MTSNEWKKAELKPKSSFMEFWEYALKEVGIDIIDTKEDAEKLIKYLKKNYQAELQDKIESYLQISLQKTVIGRHRSFIISPYAVHQLFLKIYHDRSPEIVERADLDKLFSQQGYGLLTSYWPSYIVVLERLGLGGVYEKGAGKQKVRGFSGNKEKMEWIWPFLTDKDYKLPKNPLKG